MTPQLKPQKTQNSLFTIHYSLFTVFIFILAGAVRLTNLGVFRAIDEEDRWAWAVDFYRALLAADLPATLVGDGYPGIFPAWLETGWLFAASLYRSALQGGWIGDGGVYALLHDWGRMSNLALQRFPIALANTLLVVIIFLYARKLFARHVALLAAIFISLDPFLLSDSRVNRAEALLAGLMTVSLLALIVALRERGGEGKRGRGGDTAESPSHPLPPSPPLLVSAFVGGLAVLTKLQALVLLPMFGVIVLIWFLRVETRWQRALRRSVAWMLGWTALAALTFSLLWPAMWTVPADTFALMTKFLTRKVGEEGVKIFFLGRTVLDQDPGLLFYPIILILRVAPLTLMGLLLGLWQVGKWAGGKVGQWESGPMGKWASGQRSKEKKIDSHTGSPAHPHTRTPAHQHTGSPAHLPTLALAIYALLYIGGMSLGSHKHDRFLMAIFPTLNILAAIAYVHFARFNFPKVLKLPGSLVAATVMLALSLLTALPYHPYYFSYFNPLAGGGKTAVKLTRIGWGEGMDQVADYLNTLENPQDLMVATRFYKYLLGFEGKAINLDNDGEWAQADKIVFYIQQSQRMLDPSPGVIRYFQQRVAPEKRISINGIEYAVIYPNPITYPANPQIDRLEGQLALFGYRWEEGASGAEATLIWEDLGQSDNPLAIRLWGGGASSEWFSCRQTDKERGRQGEGERGAESQPAAVSGQQFALSLPNGLAVGEVMESVCRISSAELPTGLYSLQIGAQDEAGNWQTLDFGGGRSAIQVQADGSITRVSPEVAFAQLADEALPAAATRLPRAYDQKVRLLAYQAEANPAAPGDKLALTLYWQAVEPLKQETHVTIQAFLGENRVALLNGEPSQPATSWQPGEVIADAWTIPLPADLPAPALLRLDVGLFYPDTLLPLQAQNLQSEDVPGAITRIRLLPKLWQTYAGEHPLNFTFGDAVHLNGYEITRAKDGSSLDITLYWKSLAPLESDYTAFVHLLRPDGSLAAQSDVAPAKGLYPTSAWQPGENAQSYHHLTLAPDLPPGEYTLLAGMYRPDNWERLPALDAAGNALPDNAATIGNLKLK